MFDASDSEGREHLKLAILTQLELSPDGLSEYDLLKKLQNAGFSYLDTSYADLSRLFVVHFILFHCLYQLADTLYYQRHGQLQIGPLNIQLLPYCQGEYAVQSNDPLRMYYLDIEQLRRTQPNEVYALVANFWEALNRDERRAEALSVLGLADPVSDELIQTTYRRLVMQHHPDRGGDSERLQRINLAMTLLTK